MKPFIRIKLIKQLICKWLRGNDHVFSQAKFLVAPDTYTFV